MNPLIALGIGIGFFTWGLKKLAGEGEQKENLTGKEKPPITPNTKAIDVPKPEDESADPKPVDNPSARADNLDSV